MIGLNADVHARRKSWCTCASIIVRGGVKAICQRRSSLAISAFALARQGLRCAALMGIGASTIASINFDEQ